MLPISFSRTTFVLLSSFLLVSALPFSPHPQASKPEPLLLPRASYSVVPVDGGVAAPTPGGSIGATTTVLQTITQTASAGPPTTVTIVLTNFVPVATETFISTTTVIEHATTVTLPPATITITTVGQQTTSISLITSIETIPPQTSSLPITPASTSTLHSDNDSSSRLKMTLTSMLVSPVTLTPSSGPRSSFDDGLWHTTYPAWSNTTTTPLKPPQTISVA